PQSRVPTLLIFLALLAAVNFAAAWQLRAIFPRRQALILAALVLGNAVWLAVPFAFLQGRDGVFAWARPILGPPFLLWHAFAFGYVTLSLAGLAAWLPLRLARSRSARWSRLWRRPTLAALTLFAALTLAGPYGALVPIQVRTVEVALDELPPALDGPRGALLSDLHVGLFTRE